jgi:hypothetical protein
MVVAKLVEQLTNDPKLVGSNPDSTALSEDEYMVVAELVEQLTNDHKLVCSNPDSPVLSE